MKQTEALEILKGGSNVFLTGSAGSGKTYLLNKFITYLKEKKISVWITASTVIAATHLNGRTIHSWAGLGIEEKMNASVKKSISKAEVRERIKKTQILIIDEVSMLSAKRLDLINQVCQRIRKNKEPFGGLQVILSGDFFQLPPVSHGQEDGRFVIDSDIWSAMNLKICYLEEQYRQEDKNFFKILNSLRSRQDLEKIKKSLGERMNKEIKTDITPTKLYTHNIDVDVYNNFELGKLKTEPMVYEMHFNGLKNLTDKLRGGCLAPERLELKIDAVVMFVKNNFKDGYVNGTLGKVIGFETENNYPIIKTFKGEIIGAHNETWVVEDSGGVIASISQLPLRLAWAITIHKSQGMSLDCAEIDLSKTFEYGMGYVALSRVRSLAGLKLLGLNDMALRVNEKMIKFDDDLRARSARDLIDFYETKGTGLFF